MAIINEVLDLGWDYGAQGGPQFSVTTTQTGGGFESSNLDWSQPKAEYQIGDRTGDYCIDLDQYNYLYGFWMARRGSYEGFLYKDWGDFELLSEVIGTGDGTTTQFQSTKTYGTFVRLIRYLAPGVQVDAGGTPYQVDRNSGLITFTRPVPKDVAIKLTADFYVPVKFVEDKWPGRFRAADPRTGQRFYELGSLQLRGVRV